MRVMAGRGLRAEGEAWSSRRPLPPAEPLPPARPTPALGPGYLLAEGFAQLPSHLAFSALKGTRVTGRLNRAGRAQRRRGPLRHDLQPLRPSTCRHRASTSWSVSRASLLARAGELSPTSRTRQALNEGRHSSWSRRNAAARARALRSSPAR